MPVRAVRTAGIQYVRTVFKAAKNSSLFCEIFALFFVCETVEIFSFFLPSEQRFSMILSVFLVKKS